MIKIIGHNMGGKGVDFGIVTDPNYVPTGTIFLADKPVEAGDYCLIDDGKFFTQEEQVSLLYLLATEHSKNSS